MSDLISRKAAIDKINEQQRKLIYCFGFENDMVKMMNIAKSIVIAIPSAQPEIIRCKDCKYRDKYGCCKYWKGLAMADIPIATDDNDFCSYAKRI